MSAVLITGAATGIGNLTAHALARAGHIVYASMRDLGGRNAPWAGQLQAEARDHRIDLRVVELDVTSQESASPATGSIPKEGAGIMPGGCGCPRCWWDSLG